MSDFHEINGMSVNTEPYPMYMCALFELLNGCLNNAKEFAGNLPFMKEKIPDYYLVMKYLMTLFGREKNISSDLQKISINSRYKINSSEFGKQIMGYFDGEITDQELFESTALKMEFPDENFAIKFLVALKLERVDNSLIEARKLYYDIYNNSSGLYHWLAGKQLGLDYLLNIPLIIKDGIVQQREKNYKFVASSALYDDTQKYPVENIFDNNPNSAWVKGKPGDGIGEWIEVGFEPEFTLSQIKIINGYAKSKEIYSANNRVKKVVVNFSNGKSQEFILLDGTLGFQALKLPKPVKVDSLKITIKDIYQGTKYNDTCISEIQFF